MKKLIAIALVCGLFSVTATFAQTESKAAPAKAVVAQTDSKTPAAKAEAKPVPSCESRDGICNVKADLAS